MPNDMFYAIHQKRRGPKYRELRRLHRRIIARRLRELDKINGW